MSVVMEFGGSQGGTNTGHSDVELLYAPSDPLPIATHDSGIDMSIPPSSLDTQDSPPTAPIEYSDHTPVLEDTHTILPDTLDEYSLRTPLKNVFGGDRPPKIIRRKSPPKATFDHNDNSLVSVYAFFKTFLRASTASSVAIDNKIEQAMDLVKSHLMFAVREEVDVLKERIVELMERVKQLECENSILRQYASADVLQQLQQTPPSSNSHHSSS